MDVAPWYSTLTLGTETVITLCVFYIFYRAYYEGRFNHILAGCVLAYEILFNISYMASRFLSAAPVNPAIASLQYIAIAAFHGIFSLVMFITLLVFMLLAWRAYGRGENYFRVHARLTGVFLVAWTVAILSGFVFYYITYL